jgi:hypothetical protein
MGLNQPSPPRMATVYRHLPHSYLALCACPRYFGADDCATLAGQPEIPVGTILRPPLLCPRSIDRLDGPKLTESP